MVDSDRTDGHGSLLGGSTRAVITAAAGVGLFAGLAGAAVAALLGQARSTVRLIELAAIESEMARYQVVRPKSLALGAAL